VINNVEAIETHRHRGFALLRQFAVLACLVTSLLFIGCGVGDAGLTLQPLYAKDLGVLQFKDFPKGSMIQHSFDLINTSASVLALTDFKLSCACLDVVSPASVMPNERFQVTLRFEARGLLETRDEFVTFRTGNPSLEMLTLALRCVTVPNATCEPSYSINVKLGEKDGFEERGSYTVYVSGEDALRDVKPECVSDPRLIIEFRLKSLKQINAELWAVRTPWIIRPTPSFEIMPGDVFNDEILFRSYDGCDKNVSLRIERSSRFSITPKQLFLTGSSDSRPTFTITNVAPSGISELSICGQRLAESDWSSETTKNGTLLSIEPRGAQAIINIIRSNKALGSHSLTITLDGGKVIVPVFFF